MKKGIIEATLLWNEEDTEPESGYLFAYPSDETNEPIEVEDHHIFYFLDYKEEIEGFENSDFKVIDYEVIH